MQDVHDLYAGPSGPHYPWSASTSGGCSSSLRRVRPTAATGAAATLRLRVPPQPHRQRLHHRRARTDRRYVEVTERRTVQDCAQQMRWLVDEAYPEAEVIRPLTRDAVRRLPAVRRDGWPGSWSSITRPRTAVGSPSPSANWPCWLPSASTVGSPTWPRWHARWVLGRARRKLRHLYPHPV